MVLKKVVSFRIPILNVMFCKEPFLLPDGDDPCADHRLSDDVLSVQLDCPALVNAVVPEGQRTVLIIL